MPITSMHTNLHFSLTHTNTPQQDLLDKKKWFPLAKKKSYFLCFSSLHLVLLPM